MAILEVLVFRDREILVVLVVHSTIDVIVNILGSVGKAKKDVLFVARWDIGLISVYGEVSATCLTATSSY